MVKPNTHSSSPPPPLWRLGRTLFALVAYLTFGRAIVGFVLFVANLGPGARVSDPATAPLSVALATNLALVVVFGAHHSLLARRAVKSYLHRVLSPATERSFYVLVASVLLLALVELWVPIGPVWWHLSGPAAWLLYGISFAGWMLALVASWQLDHRRLFGLLPATRQPSAPTASEEPELVTTGLYAWCRHPIYLGTFVAIWVTPIGTPGHLLLASTLSAYTLIGKRLEERDLEVTHGPAATTWREGTAAWLPREPKRPSAQPVEDSATPPPR